MSEHPHIAKSLRDKKILNILFVVAFLVLECVIGYVIYKVFKDFEAQNTDLYSMYALVLLLIWFSILIGYYGWAIYFYNINLGLTNQDWAEIRQKQKDNPDVPVDSPSENPHVGETLGLPPGTIRGTLALTMMIGGLAIAIAALGMKSEFRQNTFLVDNLDFFKTAFLMMIAFYFGNKSLEMIGYKSQKNTNIKVEGNTPGDVNAPPPGIDTTPEAETPVPGPATVNQTAQALKTGQLPASTNAPAASANQAGDDSDFDHPQAVQ